MFCISCGTNEKGADNYFHYNQPEGIPTLDPAFAKNQAIIWAVHQLYNSLVETDEELNIKPSIARHWEVSDNGLVYTFYLRDDVFFHDNEIFENGKGRKVVAADVVYSLNRITDPLTASSGAWIFTDRLDETEPFKAVNDSIFLLKLRRPFKPILGILSMQYCSIVPKEVVEKYGKEFRNQPCGTGPFQFHQWEEGQALILKKNNNYFEKDSFGSRLPYLDGVVISFLNNKATEFLQFRQGQLDFINDIDASFKDEVLTKKGELRIDWKNKVILSKHPYLNTEYYGILMDTTKDAIKNSPLKIKKIRQAINYGFDREKLVMYLRNSIGVPANSGFAPAGLPTFDSVNVRGYHYDPEKAKQLLREAGYLNGKAVPEIKLISIPVYADIANYVASQLSGVGLTVKVEVVQKSLLIEQASQSQALFFRGSWIADYPDAENYYAVFYSQNPAPPNYTRFNNKEFDRLYEQALQENNDSLRTILYHKMDRIIIDEAPVVPIWYDMVIRLINPWVKDLKPNGLNLLELKTVKKEY